MNHIKIERVNDDFCFLLPCIGINFKHRELGIGWLKWSWILKWI